MATWSNKSNQFMRERNLASAQFMIICFFKLGNLKQHFQGAQYESTIIFYLLKFIMLSIKVKSELDILASERKTTFTFLELKRVLKNATPKR